MECGTIEHTPDDLRRSLAPGKLIAVCERAFGREVKVVSAHELDGGEYNTTYLVRIAGMEPVILRVAPPRDARVFWHEEALMRKEHAIQPYFAPIATLMPRTLTVDPHLLALLGDVIGRRVLDAGCGEGYLARILAARGARVDRSLPPTDRLGAGQGHRWRHRVSRG